MYICVVRPVAILVFQGQWLELVTQKALETQQETQTSQVNTHTEHTYFHFTPVNATVVQ